MSYVISFQKYILDILEQTITENNYTPAMKYNFSNTGTLRAMKGFNIKVSIIFNFQNGYCSITIKDENNATLFECGYLEYINSE